MKGRRAEHGEPALLYDFRRGKTIIDVLAIEDPFTRKQALIMLASKWGVELDAVDPFDRSSSEIAHRLAKHALEALRNGDKRAGGL